MGNCLALEKEEEEEEEEEVKIMRMDGVIIRYQSPLEVQRVLNEFPGHAVAEEPSATAAVHLASTARMRRGRLYYLVPLQKKKLPAAGVTRVKVVLTKQEVKEMVSRGAVSHGDMMRLLRRAQGWGGEGEKEKEEQGMVRRSTLETIPEEND